MDPSTGDPTYKNTMANPTDAASGDSGLRGLTAAISRQNVKLPAFSPDFPEAFFISADAQFAAGAVVDNDMKFSLAVAQLTQAQTSRVARLLNGTATNKYDDLKRVVMEVFGRSNAQKVNDFKALAKGGVGDQNPIEFLARLRQSWDPDAFLRHTFLESLPPAVAGPLSPAEISLDEIARRAKDSLAVLSLGKTSGAAALHPTHVCEAAAAPPAVHAIDPPDTAAIQRRSQKPGHKGKTLPGLCKIHSTYGSDAFKCASPSSCKMASILAKKPTGNEDGSH